MSFRNTLVMVIILALLGGFIFYLQTSQKKEPTESPPDVWSYEEDDINHITMRLPREKKAIAFAKVVKGNDYNWFIDSSPRKPISLKRWGGIVLLLSGPQSRRVIANQVTDMDLYGLNTPSLEISLVIGKKKENLTVIVGDRTPDDKAVYVILKEHKTVYLLDHTWYEVMIRLVREPPEEKVRPRISLETTA
jgi:hypothetical protein